MARVALAPREVTRAGLTPAETAILTDGVYVQNLRGDIFLTLENTHVSAVTVTIPTSATIDGLSVTDRTYVMAADDKLIVGPFPRSAYNQNDGTFYVDVTTTNVVLADAWYLTTSGT